MCNPCFLIVGCITKPKKIGTPDGFPSPPRRVLCPHCGHITDSEYRRYNYICHFCFIPCIPCWNSDPFLSCSTCNHELGVMGDHKCNNCEVTTTFSSKNCPNCGASKDGASGEGGYKSLDMR